MEQQAKKRFLPVILGTDMNGYTMAASFHERYGIKPVMIGRAPMRFTHGSSIIQKIHYNKNLSDNQAFLDYMKEIAQTYKQTYDSLILIGANDVYVNLIMTNKEALREDYLFNYVDPELRDQLFYKKNFYRLCEKYGVDIPHTHFYDCANPGAVPTDFDFPLIVKPSNVVAYQATGMHNTNKLYKVYSQEELEQVIQTVVAGGYKDELIIQDFIPGDDTYLWDSVYYANQDGEAQLITLAQVVLQEHVPHLTGSYTAMIVRYDKEVMDNLVRLMQAIGYQGYGNFDMKYDPRDGKLKVFEVNLRQGRGSSYISYCGHHLSEYLVDDLIYNKDKSLSYLKDEFLFTVVSKRVLRDFVEDEDIKEEVNELLKQKKYANPLLYKGDKGFRRNLQMWLRTQNYYRKYKEYGESFSPGNSTKEVKKATT
ncbi:hypothetical protein [Atopococcus tabaci]|uniref:carboxylate--amine ligase n=1 Tax=Atopococcus tabaci TaxID=269774 RepID=UPI002409501D|nr:hypothetical protein [Atopococcus tabaci]